MNLQNFIRGKIESFLLIAVLLAIIYILLNIIHLAWYIASPEGFWGFNYFLDILRILLFAIPMLFIIFIIIFMIFSYFSSIIKNGFKFKDLLKSVGSFLLVLIIVIFNEYYINSASFWFTKKMADKYSYVEQSEKLIKKGKMKEAISYSKKAYKKYQSITKPPSFFILSRLYSNTKVDKDIQLTKKYASIVNLAYCKEIISENFTEAENLYNDAIYIAESEDFFLNKEEYLVMPLSALAYLKHNKGDYDGSEKIFYRLEQISDNLSKKDLEYKIQGLSVFLNSSVMSGDLSKANLLLDYILEEIYNKNELKKGSNYKSFLILKIHVELNLNNFESAKEIYSILSELEVSDNSMLYPNFLSTKAALFVNAHYRGIGYKEIESTGFLDSTIELFGKKQEKNLLQEAEKLLIEKIEILKESYGEESLFLFEAIRNLANFHRDNGSNDKAAMLYNVLINSISSRKNEMKDVYTDLLIDIISINKNVDFSIVKEAEDLVFTEVKSKILFLTERDKETYISKIENHINIINNFYLSNETPRSTIAVYNNILRFKEIALNSNINIRSFLKKLPNSTFVEYQNSLNHVRNFENVNFNENYLIEKRILNTLSSNEDFSKYLSDNIDYRLIQNCLDFNEYAVEIINTPYITDDGKLSYKYFALLIDNTLDAPLKIELFNKEDLDFILNIDGNAKTRYNKLYSTDNKASGLRDLIWKPIESKITTSSKVFISLSGDLNKVALPSLLIDLPYDIHLVSSTKNVVDIDKGYYNYSKDNIAFGGANFNSIVKFTSTRSLSSIKTDVTDKIKNGFYENLPFTIKEVEEIKSILTQENENCVVYKEDDASEINFRNLDGKVYGFVHIATHGFYYSADEIKLENKNTFNFNIDDSMGRSGILLSQNSAHEFSHKNDGIITAREISSMDFSNIDLVVLSACDTGIGDYKGSEGVFGLQRALKLSGSKKQIVSLWQVPDEETSELFASFYKYYIEGYSAFDSLKKAQITMSSKYDSFYWAGFILIE